METRRIGSLDVSVVGLGCNNFGMRIDASATEAVVNSALDAGITFFDTADIYGSTKSEQFLGKALGKRRKEAIIATKFGKPVDEHRKGAKPEYIKQAVEDSLRRLNTDYIDLYQLHQPDPSVPITDTLATLNELVEAGKVREIGCSNFTAAQLQEAEAAVADGAARFVSVQNEYSLFHREAEREVLPLCEKLNIAFLPYYPLASGLLTGKYRLGQPIPSGSRLSTGWHASRFTDEILGKVEALISFAESRGRTILELAVSWLLARPGVASVIAGATSPDQVTVNAASAVWKLDPSELNEIDKIVVPGFVV
jgi:aryl-alcohol dehydrogenase-like predicted oxidoreductase